MDGGNTEHVQALLRACDEMLDYHESAGHRDAAVVRELQAKRAQLSDRLSADDDAAVQRPTRAR